MVSKTPARAGCWQHGAFSHRAAELLPEMENVLCPIASIPLFHFQVVTIAEATISSISHLAYSKLEWVGFSLAYKWATGSRMSSRWDYGLDMRKDLRVWPWNKVQGFLLGSYTVQRENWVHQNVMQISWQCLGSGMRFGPSVHACSKTQISPWESALSLTWAGQGSLRYFEPQSCPCPKAKIIHVSRRNPIPYFIHPSLPQWLRSVTQWTQAISEQGWGTPIPFTGDVFLFRQYFGTWLKGEDGERRYTNKHRHPREPVSDPIWRPVPWQNRCPCTFSHHYGTGDKKLQPEHNTAPLASAFTTSCWIRNRCLLHPSFRRKHRLCLRFIRAEIISSHYMGSGHNQQVRLLVRFWDLPKTGCPSTCFLGQEKTTDLVALGWPWMPRQPRPLGACWRGQGLLQALTLDLTFAIYVMSANK